MVGRIGVSTYVLCTLYSTVYKQPQNTILLPPWLLVPHMNQCHVDMTRSVGTKVQFQAKTVLTLDAAG